MQTSIHVPVLETEVIEYLAAKKGGYFLDCTMGGGGHAQAILNANSMNKVFAIDRDSRALERAEKKFEGFKDRISFAKSNFGDVLKALQENDITEKFDGILADLGVSTDQLKETRGFSFNDENTLDMRMDEAQPKTAYEVVNKLNEKDLYVVLKRGGVGGGAKQVVDEIIKKRPIVSAKELAQIVCKSLPLAVIKKDSAKGVHPATVVFQAIRMAVNEEIAQLDSLLKDMPSLVKIGGMIAIITFHSIEDKIVTKTMREWEQGDTAPANWRGKREGKKSLGYLVTKKAIVPTEEEVLRNTPSRSARLRVFCRQ